MEIRERLDSEECEAISRPSLRLFLSADIVNSTALKQRFSPEESRSSGKSWLEIIHRFYTSFPDFLTRSLADLSSDSAEESFSPPELWKSIGDELVFVANIDRLEDILPSLEAFRLATNRWNRALEKEQVLVKSAAWIAGFPVTNSIIPVNEKWDHDFIGPSIDIGFRLCQFASPRKFTVSVDLAWIIASLDSGDKSLHRHLHYEGRKTMKGVLQNRPYPIFWIDNFGLRERPDFSEIDLSEDKVIGRAYESIDPNWLLDFAEHWIASMDGKIIRPFSPIPDKRFPIPPEYETAAERAKEELERIFLESNESREEDGSDEGFESFEDYVKKHILT